MFDVLKYSLQFVGGFGGYTSETLDKLVNGIIIELDVKCG